MNLIKKRLRQLGWILGIVALSLAVCIGMEHVRGRQAFKPRLGELKAKGEELSVVALEPAHPPAERNAALALSALTNEISQLHSNLLELPPFGRFVAPGRMVAMWQIKAWSGDKKSNDWQDPIQTMEESKDVLQAIHAALQRSEWDGGFDYRQGFFEFRSPLLAHLKATSQILVMAAACELKQGRTNAMLERLVDGARLVRLQKDERLIITQLVRIACAAVAWNSAWGVLQTNAWSEPQLAGLQAEWQEMDFAADMAKALEVERAMTLDLFKWTARVSGKANSYFQQQEEAAAIFGGEFSFLPTHGALLYWVHLPLWRMAWAQQDARRALDRWQELIETERMARNGSWAAAKDRADRLDAAAEDNSWFRSENDEPKQNIYNRWRYLLSNQTFGVGGSLVRRVLEAETARRMLVAALALKRHILRHGQPAATLDVLLPELLSAVPIDCMNGKPLRYRPNPDGTFLLYSVGEDGEDNGGDSSLPKGKTNFTRIWDGKDAVWPTPASSEEVARIAW